MKVITVFAILVCISCISCIEVEEGESGAYQLQPIHTIEVEGQGVDLDVDENSNILALSVRDKGIRFFETSKEDRPIDIGSIDLPQVYKSLVKDKTVFGFDEMGGLSTIDLRDLDQLNLVSALTTTELYGYVNDAALFGQKLILANESVGLKSYTIEDNFSLLNEKVDPASQESIQGTSSISLLSDQFVTASFHGVINNYDLEDGLAPQLVGSVSTSIKISDLSCKLEFCYGAAFANGLSLIQVHDSGEVSSLGLLELDKTIDLVFVDEDNLYVSFLALEKGNGWYVFDISVPHDPILIRTILSDSPIRDFEKVRSNLYVLEEGGKLQIFHREDLTL